MDTTPARTIQPRKKWHTPVSILLIAVGILSLSMGILRLILQAGADIPVEFFAKVIHSFVQGLAISTTGILMLVTKWPQKGAEMPRGAKIFWLILVCAWLVTSVGHSLIESAVAYGMIP